MKDDKQIKQISILVSCACVMQILETMFPHPVPGIRLGFANMITLIALVNLGFRASIEIAVLRTVVSSFIVGTFLSPAFVLSFSGALTSTIIMGVIYRISVRFNKSHVSIVSISLAGAIVHNITQIVIVYLFIIHNRGVLMLVPWLAISSVATGWITGLVAIRVCNKIRMHSDDPVLEETGGVDAGALRSTQYKGLNSPVYLLPPVVKITSVLAIALAMIITNDLIIYGCLFSFLILASISAKVRFTEFLIMLRKLSGLILFSFFVPVFFNAGGATVLHAGPLSITQQGLNIGAVFSIRLILLMLAAVLLVKTTSPEKIAEGLQKILYPLKVFGISSNRIASIIMLSWNSVPFYWGKIFSLVKERGYKEKNFKKLIPDLSDLLASIYQQSKEIQKKGGDTNERVQDIKICSEP